MLRTNQGAEPVAARPMEEADDVKIKAHEQMINVVKPQFLILM